jgi:hypothetical protein
VLLFLYLLLHCHLDECSLPSRVGRFFFFCLQAKPSTGKLFFQQWFQGLYASCSCTNKKLLKMKSMFQVLKNGLRKAIRSSRSSHGWLPCLARVVVVGQDR